MKVTHKDLVTQSPRWLQWAIETAREYKGETFEFFIKANGFKPEHEAAIRSAMK